MFQRVCALLLCLLIIANPLVAQQPGPANYDARDYDVLTRIREEGFHHSQIPELANQLMNGIGPRLTNSPAMRKANDWAVQTMQGFGLENAHNEKWGPFGKGWAYDYVHVRLTAPYAQELSAIPLAWTPGTKGVVKTSRVLHVNIQSKDDFDKYRGKLAGAVVLVGDIPPRRDDDSKPHPRIRRYDKDALESEYEFEIPRNGPSSEMRYRQRVQFLRDLIEFLQQEKVAVAIQPSSRGDGQIVVQGSGAYFDKYPQPVPTLVMMQEHYTRLADMADKHLQLEIEIDSHVQWFDQDAYGYNSVAEIPGSDLKDQVVMLGAHMDSWHGGTGATDNGAGTIVAIEAARILKAIGLKPRRTIRVALWSGEEQGLYGSKGYVRDHFATWPLSNTPDDAFRPEIGHRQVGPIQTKPEHAKLSAYYNLDNGTGRARGIYAEDNAGAARLFEQWIEPLADLGVSTVSMNHTGSTDHVNFDDIGLPGFQFIQDEIQYETETHHSQLDTSDHLSIPDLEQDAVVMAWFVYNTAMRDQMMPRKPMPRWTPPRDESQAEPQKGNAQTPQARKEEKPPQQQNPQQQPPQPH